MNPEKAPWAVSDRINNIKSVHQLKQKINTFSRGRCLLSILNFTGRHCRLLPLAFSRLEHILSWRAPAWRHPLGTRWVHSPQDTWVSHGVSHSVSHTLCPGVAGGDTFPCGMRVSVEAGQVSSDQTWSSVVFVTEKLF